MSYDLMVFQPEAVPHECAAFVQWYDQQTADWKGYGDKPDPAAPALQAWFRDMRAAGWPAMNGSYATTDYDDDRVTGYTIGPIAIYIDFRWNHAETAYKATTSMAQRHSLGFYDVSGSGDVWLPKTSGGYDVLKCGFPKEGSGD